MQYACYAEASSCVFLHAIVICKHNNHLLAQQPNQTSVVLWHTEAWGRRAFGAAHAACASQTARDEWGRAINTPLEPPSRGSTVCALTAFIPLFVWSCAPSTRPWSRLPGAARFALSHPLFPFFFGHARHQHAPGAAFSGQHGVCSHTSCPPFLCCHDQQCLQICAHPGRTAVPLGRQLVEVLTCVCGVHLAGGLPCNLQARVSRRCYPCISPGSFATPHPRMHRRTALQPAPLST